MRIIPVFSCMTAFHLFRRNRIYGLEEKTFYVDVSVALVSLYSLRHFCKLFCNFPAVSKMFIFIRNKLYLISQSSHCYKGAFKANDRCYEKFNTRGDKHGYCKRYSSSSYLACASK